jgi:hypothetical protein
MRKLKLDVDALQVESFQVTAPGADHGTVEGRMRDPAPSATCGDCNSVGTCIGPTFCCPATWKASCAATCIYTDCDSCQTFCISCLVSCMQTCGAETTCAQFPGCGSL